LKKIRHQLEGGKVKNVAVSDLVVEEITEIGSDYILAKLSTNRSVVIPFDDDLPILKFQKT